MVTANFIKFLIEEYDDGCVWLDVEDICSFFFIIFIMLLAIPAGLLFDILLMPIEILIFIIRKYQTKKYGDKKYTLKDFIKEI